MINPNDQENGVDDANIDDTNIVPKHTINDEEVDEILKNIKKEKPSFSLKINEDELKQIPDYLEENMEQIKKPKHHMSIFAKIMLAITILGISVLLSLTIIFVGQDVYGMGKPDYEINVEIPEKAGIKQISQILQENGLVKSAFIFQVFYKIGKYEGGLNYGRFDLNQNMSYDALVNSLQKYASKKEEVTVVFPEGLTIYEMATKLEKAEVCKADEFIKTLNTTNFKQSFIKDVKPGKLRFHKLEGYVFPETYNFYKNDNPYNVANKMLTEFEKRVTKEMQESMKTMQYTLDETMTIASIVQKEAGKTSEMKKVASVYFNRLKNKDVYPNLQACPTRDYANQLKKQMDIIDQPVIDAYNTYEDAGLPPGAICNPGVAALEATLNPDKTDYYYFCTDLKSGKFYYAKTLKEHQRNVIKAGLA